MGLDVRIPFLFDTAISMISLKPVAHFEASSFIFLGVMLAKMDGPMDRWMDPFIIIDIPRDSEED